MAQKENIRKEQENAKARTKKSTNSKTIRKKDTTKTGIAKSEKEPVKAKKTSQVQGKTATGEMEEKVKNSDRENTKNLKENTGSTQEKSNGKSQTSKNLWEGIQKNVSTGAKSLNEEARELADKVSGYSESIFDAIRNKAKGAFKQGSDLTAEGVNYAQKITEQYRDRQEIKKLNEEKEKIASQLGIYIYLSYKNNNNRVPVQTFAQKKVKTVMKELEEIDKKIIELSDDQ